MRALKGFCKCTLSKQKVGHGLRLYADPQMGSKMKNVLCVLRQSKGPALLGALQDDEKP